MTSLEEVKQRAQIDADNNGYHLNIDPTFLKSLLEGLKRNEDQYGYPSCPCRLSSGKLEFDRDIICPCDYRDLDVEEYGCCYCALYVKKEMSDGKTPIKPIPERRPKKKQIEAYTISAATSAEKPSAEPVMSAKKPSENKAKMWYCKQCGYICFRGEPPYVCPICRAKREMFAEITTHTEFIG